MLNWVVFPDLLLFVSRKRYLSQEYLGGAIGFLVGCAWGGVIGVLYGINFGIQLTLASIEEMNAVDDEGDS
eukprot:m.113175 g.113175  ORF g.113175 m.113175 type:complete len:71 (-) comp17065_c0_seq2:124-336(-)